MSAVAMTVFLSHTFTACITLAACLVVGIRLGALAGGCERRSGLHETTVRRESFTWRPVADRKLPQRDSISSLSP